MIGSPDVSVETIFEADHLNDGRPQSEYPLMPEVLRTPELERPNDRPFPWYCPRCRQKTVWRTIVNYQCQRLDHGQADQVIVPDLAVPKCASCGELVFDYLAEDQINTAFVKLVGARTPPTSSHQTSKD
jgi:hypothetical protein